MGNQRTEDSATGRYMHGFQGWKEHSNGLREDTDLVTLEFLREIHPEYHLTRTSPAKCDLLGFANAGYATATRDNSQNYDALRIYKEPSSRLSKKPGVLADQTNFGRWRYTWLHQSFLVYEVEYVITFQGPKKALYVLSPHSHDGVQSLHHATTDELLLASGAWTTELHKEIYVFDDAQWTKDKTLWQSVQDATWEDVILNAEMKANLIKDVQGFFDNRQLYQSLSVPWKRGVILHGVPGNGKTVSIKALINSLASRPEPIPSLYVKSFDACNGPKWSIRSIFTKARTMAPCILIFEDLDSLVEDETRSYFLNEVDGLESNDGILMIGSTNHLDQLDPAISKRPSRFDRKYHFKVPNEEERAAYCEYWRHKPYDSDMVYFPAELCPVIAKMTEGFSFAYLKELFIAALLSIARGAGLGDFVNTSEVQGSDGGSSGDGVVVEQEDATTELPAAGSEGEETKNSDPKKRTMPQVEVPEAFKDNLLLRVLRAQSQVLIEEMDNSDESEEPIPKKPGQKHRNGDYQLQLAMLRAQSAKAKAS